MGMLRTFILSSALSDGKSDSKAPVITLWKSFARTPFSGGGGGGGGG
eukprot:CAMPEP_0185252382 /NCGR_PEP_ID=MMETSP1359-20130426/1487_1 /TAXON_ID=552665 /ORGANISM="Bigelowiella longifila, Strain CCMP242" /LENGTH=46 /DNA_ID= /DNA_START= /DNA_END= /DNA_ORIENTATION=